MSAEIVERLHPRQVALARRVLRVYQNSTRGQWSKLLVSVRRQSFKRLVYRMRTDQAETWGLFGTWAWYVTWSPKARTKAGTKGAYILWVRYPDVDVHPQPKVELDLVNLIHASILSGAPEDVTTVATPEDWRQWRYQQALRDKGETLRPAHPEGVSLPPGWEVRKPADVGEGAPLFTARAVTSDGTALRPISDEEFDSITGWQPEVLMAEPDPASVALYEDVEEDILGGLVVPEGEDSAAQEDMEARWRAAMEARSRAY